MFKNVDRKLVLTCLIVLVVGLVMWLWGNGYFSYWMNGMKHLASEPNETYFTTESIDDSYTVELDLSDLKSNEDKILFREETGQHIYVSKVSESQEEVYEVVFRSKGKYGHQSAYLSSGLKYKATSDGYDYELTAKATANYQGKEFKLSPAEQSGLIYKDGDEFGFKLDMKDLSINIQKQPIIQVTLSNLVTNIWIKKELFRQ